MEQCAEVVVGSDDEAAAAVAVSVVAVGAVAAVEDSEEDADEFETDVDRVLLSLGLDAQLISDTRPVGFDAVSEGMLELLDRRRQEAAVVEDYEAAQAFHDAFQACFLAATSLQTVSEAFEQAMAREDFDRGAELKAKALSLRRDQERAFDPVGFEELERRKEDWRRSFGRGDADADECLAAYHSLVADGQATEKDRDAFLSCLPADLAMSVAPALLEVESMALSVE